MVGAELSSTGTGRFLANCADHALRAHVQSERCGQSRLCFWRIPEAEPRILRRVGRHERGQLHLPAAIGRQTGRGSVGL